MVLTDLVEMALEAVAGFVGAHGLETGLIAVVLVGWYHLHHITGWLRSASSTLRTVGTVAAVLGVIAVLGISLGWFDIGALPDLPFLVVVA